MRERRLFNGWTEMFLFYPSYPALVINNAFFDSQKCPAWNKIFNWLVKVETTCAGNTFYLYRDEKLRSQDYKLLSAYIKMRNWGSKIINDLSTWRVLSYHFLGFLEDKIINQ